MRKNKERLFWISMACIAAVIIALGVLGICLVYKTQENIFFVEYEGEYDRQDSIIYQYSSKSKTAVEVGRVQGQLVNCVINSEETCITGMLGGETLALLRYDLATETACMLDAAGEIAALTDDYAGIHNTLLYNGGNKVFVWYEDENEEGKMLLYDLATGQYEMVEEEKTAWRLFTIQDDSLWYIGDNNSLYQYDLATREKTRIMASAYYDSVVLPQAGLVAYTRGSTKKQVYLYDMGTQESRCIAQGGWNTFYGELHTTHSRWSDNGREFFYIEYFPGLFNEATTKLMVYNVITGSSRCIYKVRMTTHDFDYVWKR